MKRTLLLDLPALSFRLLEALPDERRPAWLKALISRGRSVIEPVLPAVTMPVQASVATGKPPEVHGIVANGLPTFRMSSDHRFLDTDSYPEYRTNVSCWEQAAELVQHPRFWQQPGSQCSVAMICVQSSIGAADVVVTPKPTHTPDGKTIPDCWTAPGSLNDELKAQFGPLPLMHYWGPLANIKSSQWIANASQYIWQHHPVDLQWVYVPHLDYNAQRLGPTDPKLVDDLTEVLEVITPLVEQAERDGGRVILFSEYGMTQVHRHLAPNVLLREAGLLTTKLGPDGAPVEVDFDRMPAFALCDHQVAHIYCRDAATVDRVQKTLENQGEIARLVRNPCSGNPRIAELTAYAAEDAWFEYRWWSDWSEAPDYAWTVDIHRKPGYDPTELFVDMEKRRIRADQPELVKGSHGTLPADRADWPVLLGIRTSGNDPVAMIDLHTLLL